MPSTGLGPFGVFEARVRGVKASRAVRSYWVVDSKLKAIFRKLLNEQQGPSEAEDERQVNARYTMHDVMAEYTQRRVRPTVVLLFDDISRGARV